MVGSGIVGLSCALFLKRKHPKSKILVLERGLLPQGASTKNAGFACFGSISEILSDLKKHSEKEVQELVKNRFEGIQLLRSILGDKILGYKQHGGHEVFLNNTGELFEECLEKMKDINGLLEPVFGEKVFQETKNAFRFKKVKEKYISHILEGQIDTGQMMNGLMRLCISEGILILNGIEVNQLEEKGKGVSVSANGFEFMTEKAFVATNGFASKLLSGYRVKPARAQVLITHPIPNLKIKGTFHLEEGYYYFRNIDNRILLGGGRNLDFIGEETTEMGETELIQSKLESLLKEVILPDTPIEIAQRWSGIMGVGKKKTPIIEQVSTNVYCGIRMGGMGIALGCLVGKRLSDYTS